MTLCAIVRKCTADAARGQVCSSSQSEGTAYHCGEVGEARAPCSTLRHTSVKRKGDGRQYSGPLPVLSQPRTYSTGWGHPRSRWIFRLDWTWKFVSMVIRNLIKLTRLTVTWAEELAQHSKELTTQTRGRGSDTWDLRKCLVDLAARNSASEDSSGVDRGALPA